MSGVVKALEWEDSRGHPGLLLTATTPIGRYEVDLSNMPKDAWAGLRWCAGHDVLWGSALLPTEEAAKAAAQADYEARILSALSPAPAPAGAVEIPEGWTPGPWFSPVDADEYSVDRVGCGLCYSAVGPEDGRAVALVVVPSSFAMDDIQEANARLIALAPQMAAELVALRADKNDAYEERNRLVALLASLYPSGTARPDIPGWDPEWLGCVYIDFPWGQASWHFHDAQAHLFAHLPPYAGEWDGHTTAEKYEAIQRAAITAALSPAPQALAESVVKPLVWVSDRPGPLASAWANSLIGPYYVDNIRGYQLGDDKQFKAREPYHTGFESYHPDQASAKAACQAVYEASVLGAIDVPALLRAHGWSPPFQARAQGERIERLVAEIAEAREQIKGYEEAQASKRALTRQIAVLIDGDGAARQPSLCDIVPMVRELVAERGNGLRYGMEPAAVAGWDACRKLAIAGCAIIEAKAAEALTCDLPAHMAGFYRGEQTAARSLAKGLASIEAKDDGHFQDTLRALADGRGRGDAAAQTPPHPAAQPQRKE